MAVGLCEESWISASLCHSSNHGNLIYHLCRTFCHDFWRGNPGGKERLPVCQKWVWEGPYMEFLHCNRRWIWTNIFLILRKNCFVVLSYELTYTNVFHMQTLCLCICIYLFGIHIFLLLLIHTYLKLHCIFECVKVMINIFIILHMYCVYDHYHSL